VLRDHRPATCTSQRCSPAHERHGILGNHSDIDLVAFDGEVLCARCCSRGLHQRLVMLVAAMTVSRFAMLSTREVPGPR